MQVIILNRSTNLCPETIIEAKTTLESIYSLLKRSKFTYNYEFRKNYVKIFTKEYNILYLCKMLV